LSCIYRRYFRCNGDSTLVYTSSISFVFYVL